MPMKANEIRELLPGTRLFRKVKPDGEMIECEVIEAATTKLLRDVRTGRKWPIWDYKNMELML